MNIPASKARALVAEIKQACREKPSQKNHYGLQLWGEIEAKLSAAILERASTASDITDEQIAVACSDIFLSNYPNGVGYDLAIARAVLALAAPTAQPIECDEETERFYIPLPGGWEIQTKGKGSSFRICNTLTGMRWIVTDERLHSVLEELARDAHTAVVIAEAKK